MSSRIRAIAIALTGAVFLTLGLAVNAGATFPGHNGQIAFDRSHDILATRSNGTCCRSLTNSPERDDTSPSYSPNGGRIAWIRDSNIWIMHADGSHKHRLTDNDTSSAPTFSPNGKEIIYSSDGFLRVVQTDGAHDHGIGVAGFNPAWSPTENWIVYTRFIDGGFDIYKVHPNGNVPVPLADTSDFEGEPDWSPNGQRIVYELNGAVHDLYLMNDNGDNQHPASGADSSAGEGSPVFSPNGRRIAFALMSNGDSDIYSVAASGGTAKPVTATMAYDALPSWQPR